MLQPGVVVPIRYTVIASSTSKAAVVSPVDQRKWSAPPAHKIADLIYEKLTGEKGVFATRITYVNKLNGRYQLQVADADGFNPQPVVSSKEPIISPSWSPDGTKLAYVSFEKKKPIVFVQSLLSGQRMVLANFKGNNSAPSWSPDGTKLAIVLTYSANSQIYVINADGSGLQQVSFSSGIDTEPEWSPDGSAIYFTSNRGGGPQIYRMAAAGGEAIRRTRPRHPHDQGDGQEAPRQAARRPAEKSRQAAEVAFSPRKRPQKNLFSSP